MFGQELRIGFAAIGAARPSVTSGVIRIQGRAEWATIVPRGTGNGGAAYEAILTVDTKVADPLRGSTVAE